MARTLEKEKSNNQICSIIFELTFRNVSLSLQGTSKTIFREFEDRDEV